MGRISWLARGISSPDRRVPVEVRWERVQERNLGASATFEFAVTREMFETMEARWEMPGAEERAAFAG